MRTYHPESYSQQARGLASRMFEQYIFYLTTTPKYAEDEALWEECRTEQHYCHFFANSYRDPKIRHRAAKKFGKMWRKYHNV